MKLELTCWPRATVALMPSSAAAHDTSTVCRTLLLAYAEAIAPVLPSGAQHHLATGNERGGDIRRERSVLLGRRGDV